MKLKKMEVNHSKSLWGKFKGEFKIDIMQLTLAGILLAVGIISEGYIRIGYTTFVTFGIYLAVGLLLPLWLGLATGALIDLLYLVLIGWIGDWYWTMGLEKWLIVIIGWGSKFLYTAIKSKKLLVTLSIVTLSVILTVGLWALIYKGDQFSTEKMMVRGKLEDSAAYTTRWITNSFAIVGLTTITIFILWNVYNYIKNKKQSEYLVTVLMASFAAVIVMWIYHPWNVAMWYKYKRGIDNWHLYEIYEINAILKSIFYIGIGVPVVSMFWQVSKLSSRLSKENRF